jgi:tRNA pseudouridine38-40 synthase
VEFAEKEGTFESYQARQEDVASFWETAEEVYAKPILDKLDPDIRKAVMAAIDSSEEEIATSTKLGKKPMEEEVELELLAGELQSKEEQTKDVEVSLDNEDDVHPKLEAEGSKAKVEAAEVVESNFTPIKDENPHGELAEISKSVLSPLEQAIKDVKTAHIIAKKAYRISDARRKMVEETLNCYVGTQNFHNYTIQKSFSDPSAKRVIRSFKVGPNPIIINDTEWLSLKVHGQSFMMHQIRKMVAMAALVVRCGSSRDIIKASYGPANISIPKAPALGLLLERPVFDSYNEKAVKEYSREKIDFDKYQREMDEFKQREIYDRMFRDEERDHQ